MDPYILKQTLSLYSNASWKARLHIRMRMALCPFERVAAFVPVEGLIMDLGCGHGLFTNALALEKPGRYMVGIEPSANKIAVAKATQQKDGRVQFIQGDALSIPIKAVCRAIVIIDVLYLLQGIEQERILRNCFDLLEAGGILLLKTMDSSPRWKVVLNCLEEWLAVRVIRITLGGKNRFTFRSLADWAALFQRVGLETKVFPIDHGYYHPHGIVMGIKP